MLKHIRRGIDRVIWGRSDATCEECGRVVAAHDAVRRGQHVYCSTEHEAADTLERTMAVPLSDDMRTSVAATAVAQ